MEWGQTAGLSPSDGQTDVIVRSDPSSIHYFEIASSTRYFEIVRSGSKQYTLL